MPYLQHVSDRSFSYCHDIVTSVSAAYLRGAYFKYSIATSIDASFKNVSENKL